MHSTTTPEASRFDESFIIAMIRDFFLALITVTVFELGLKLSIVLYDFYVDEKEEVQDTAERLASNVQSIMLNQGGPVAAMTVYPILKKNHEKLGFTVAIKPSQMTVDAIEGASHSRPPASPPIGRAGPTRSPRCR